MLPEAGTPSRVLLPVSSTPPRGVGRRFATAPRPVEAAAAERPVITSEGVVLELNPAGLASRLAAALIDLLMLYVIATALTTVLSIGAAVLNSPTLAAIGVAVVSGAALLAYPIVLETLWDGRTLGKAALGLRVVTSGGAPIGFRAAAVRAALLLVDVALVPIGALWCAALLLSPSGRRLGDIAAGTVVVRERRSDLGVARPIAFIPSPDLFGYVGQLDVGRLDPAGYRLIRSVLLRQKGLAAGGRHALTERTASSVARRLGHPPVPQLSAVQYLTCVASAYQLRHRGVGR